MMVWDTSVSPWLQLTAIRVYRQGEDRSEMMLDEARMFGRYVVGLREFVRKPLGREECRRHIGDQLRGRGETFLQILERGIYARPGSPYRKLLRHAGAEWGDVAALVRQEGVEAALGKLYEAGVYVRLDEFKGRRGIERPGLSIEVQAKDFDNPFLVRQYAGQTGGSRGVPTRVVMDLDLLLHEVAYYRFFMERFGLEGRTMGVWRETLPSAAGVKAALRWGKLGQRVEKWFTQHRLQTSQWKYRAFAAYTVWAGSVPAPEHVPVGEAATVARWLAGVKERGRAGLLDTNATSGIRVCRAALEERLDIAGTFFRLGGEPYTAARARLVQECGCEAVCNYHTAETGVLGMTCGARLEPGEVHLMTDAFGVIQRPKQVAAGMEVGALVYTSLLTACPKLLLNVEMGDYGTLSDRRCGCVWEELGMTVHLQGIRSYEKLTTAGMTFLGPELFRVVEEVLPARFGGGPTDYQFVEEEEGGLGQVSLVVSPRVGEVGEREVAEAVLQALEGCPGGKLMAGVWRDGGTLRVRRQEPYATAAAKILPLHLLQGATTEME